MQWGAGGNSLEVKAEFPPSFFHFFSPLWCAYEGLCSSFSPNINMRSQELCWGLSAVLASEVGWEIAELISPLVLPVYCIWSFSFSSISIKSRNYCPKLTTVKSFALTLWHIYGYNQHWQWGWVLKWLAECKVHALPMVSCEHNPTCPC